MTRELIVHKRDVTDLSCDYVCKTVSHEDWSSFKWREVNCKVCLEKRPME